MLQALKSSKKTTGWGIATVVSEVIRNTPSLLYFLPDDLGKYIFGISSIIFAVATVLSAQDKLTPAQQEIKELKKEADREELKKEIATETAVLVKEAKALVDEKIAPIMQVLPVVAPSSVVQAMPDSPQTLVVESIQTESITTGEIKDSTPKAEVVEEDHSVEIPNQ